MKVTSHESERFVELDSDERDFYGITGVRDAYPLEVFVLVAACSVARTERNQERANLERVMAIFPETQDALSRFLLAMEGRPDWVVDVRVEAQLEASGVDPNPMLDGIGDGWIYSK